MDAAVTPLSTEDRIQILRVLREYAGVPGPPYNPGHSVVSLAQEARTTFYEAFLVVHELANIGAIIPGGREQNAQAHLVQSVRDAQGMFNSPSFLITAFGRQYLLDASLNAGSGDAENYVALLRARLPGVPDTAQQYAAEAKRAFDRGLWFAVSVLLGVAAK